jgi:hypothetical protein
MTSISPVWTRVRAAAASRGWAVLVPMALVSATLGCAYAYTLAPGVTWANDGADSGDLIAATATLGVAHPTGYPTYLLLARLFQLIPLGDLALRSTIFSAVAAVLAALCVYLLVRRLLTRQPGPAAWVAALAIGLAPGFWSQAVIAEVYSLNALFVALILLFTLQAIQNPAPKHAWATRGEALIVGLAMGNHITAAGAAVAWFGMAAIAMPHAERRQLLVRRTLWFSMGLLVYLYLPLRASTHPPINWGDPRDWSGFWWEISGQPYRELAFGLPTNLIYGRVAAWAALLVQQFGAIGLGLGFVGLLYGAPNARPFVWLSAGVGAVASAFAIAYNTNDSSAYLIPTFLIFAVWLGLGVALALRVIARLHPLAAHGATVGLLLLLAWRTVVIAPQVDASQDRRAIVYATSVLASAPRNAIVVSDSDLDTFPLWYYHYALGERPDLVVLVDPLLEFAWYRHNLRAVYPDLQIPETVEASWLDAITAANRQRTNLCRTQVTGARVLACAPLALQP